jgi:hypothetical protein
LKLAAKTPRPPRRAEIYLKMEKAIGNRYETRAMKVGVFNFESGFLGALGVLAAILRS